MSPSKAKQREATRRGVTRPEVVQLEATRRPQVVRPEPMRPEAQARLTLVRLAQGQGVVRVGQQAEAAQVPALSQALAQARPPVRRFRSLAAGAS